MRSWATPYALSIMGTEMVMQQSSTSRTSLFISLFCSLQFFSGFQLPFQHRQWLRRWQGYQAILCCSLHNFVSCLSKSQLQRWRSAYGQRETMGDADQRSGPDTLAQVQLQRAIPVLCQKLSTPLPPTHTPLPPPSSILCNPTQPLLFAQGRGRPCCSAVIHSRIPRE
jgi:hypothetical protein